MQLYLQSIKSYKYPDKRYSNPFCTIYLLVSMVIINNIIFNIYLRSLKLNYRKILVNYKASALPTELCSMVTERCNNSLQLGIDVTYTNKCKKVLSTQFYLEMCIYAKSTQLIFFFCLDFEFFHHFPPSRVVKKFFTGIIVPFDQCVL